MGRNLGTIQEGLKQIIVTESPIVSNHLIFSGDNGIWAGEIVLKQQAKKKGVKPLRFTYQAIQIGIKKNKKNVAKSVLYIFWSGFNQYSLNQPCLLFFLCGGGQAGIS